MGVNTLPFHLTIPVGDESAFKAAMNRLAKTNRFVPASLILLAGKAHRHDWQVSIWGRETAPNGCEVQYYVGGQRIHVNTTTNRLAAPDVIRASWIVRPATTEVRTVYATLERGDGGTLEGFPEVISLLTTLPIARPAIE